MSTWLKIALRVGVLVVLGAAFFALVAIQVPSVSFSWLTGPVGFVRAVFNHYMPLGNVVWGLLSSAVVVMLAIDAFALVQAGVRWFLRATS